MFDFGVSGLLRFSNVIMYDRQTESWWQQVGGEAIVGHMTGRKLELLPMSGVSWKQFKSSFPEGKVLSRDTGYSRPYGYNPYVSYDRYIPYLYSGPIDNRLPALARVVAVTSGEESLVVPFSFLRKEPVVHYELAGQSLVVFFQRGTASAVDDPLIAQGRDVGAAGVFDPVVEERELSFRAEGEGFADEQTGSTWNLLGKATSGPLKGVSLKPIPHHGGEFWFSWVAYRPDTVVYRGD